VREGTPIADLAAVAPGRTAADAAAAVLADPDLAGWLLSTDNPSLAARLIRVGAKPRRHAFVMQCDLREPLGEPVIDSRFSLGPLPDADDRAAWRAVLPSWRDAYPSDHPDHFPGDDDTAVAFLRRLVDGTELGRLHPASTLLVDSGGRPVAGIMVNVRSQDPPWGGPWIADIWRDPSLRGEGVGSLLITHARRVLAEDGFATLGLTVTHANPARRSYERAGFRVVVESQTVLLPG